MNLQKSKLLQKGSSGGFTLVELMVVLSIIAILSIIGLVIYSQVQKDTRNSKKIQDVKAIGGAYEVHFDGTINKYAALTPNQFAAGLMPVAPGGGDYNYISGPDASTPQGLACGTVKICAPLEGGSSNCSNSSANCYCYIGLQGSKDCLASIPTPSGPPSSSPSPGPGGCPNYPSPAPTQPYGTCGYYIHLSFNPPDLNGQVGPYSGEAKCNPATGECWSANGTTGVDYPGGNVQRYFCTGKIAECDNTHNPSAVISGPEYGNYYQMTTTIPCDQTEQLDVFDGSGVLKGYMVWYSGSC